MAFLFAHDRNRIKRREGFTLIEFLLTVAITAVLAVMILANVGQSERNLAVDLSARTVAGAIREAQNMALGGARVASPLQTPSGGFGIHFQLNQSQAVLFADFNSSHAYESGQTPAEEQRTILLDTRVSINALSPSVTCGVTSCFDVVFSPPNPDVFFNGIAASVNGTITLAGPQGTTKAILINPAGAISIQ